MGNDALIELVNTIHNSTGATGAPGPAQGAIRIELRGLPAIQEKQMRNQEVIINQPVIDKERGILQPLTPDDIIKDTEEITREIAHMIRSLVTHIQRGLEENKGEFTMVLISEEYSSFSFDFYKWQKYVVAFFEQTGWDIRVHKKWWQWNDRLTVKPNAEYHLNKISELKMKMKHGSLEQDLLHLHREEEKPCSNSTENTLQQK
jgi:hypothetical protein